MVVQVEPPLVENSQRITFPVYAVSSSVPLFAPEQTVAAAATVPPTETGEIVIVAEVEFAEAQVPL